jgi:hypothetical protein
MYIVISMPNRKSIAFGVSQRILYLPSTSVAESNGCGVCMTQQASIHDRISLMVGSTFDYRNPSFGRASLVFRNLTFERLH